MSWSLLLLLAAILFFNRYLFLDPNVPIKLPPLLRQSLKYSAPCLLTAICAPIIFLDQDKALHFAHNPYLIASIISIMLALTLKNMLMVVILSLICFYLLIFYMQ